MRTDHKLYLMVILLCFIQSTSNAQSGYADSILQQIQSTTDDSIRTMNYFALADHFSRRDLQLARTYLDSARQPNSFSQKPFARAQVLLSEGTLAIRSKNPASSVEVLEQAAIQFDAIGHTDGFSKCHYKLGSVKVALSKYAEANEHFLKVKKLAEEINDSTAISNCLSAMGVVQRRMGHLDVAYANYEESLSFTPKENTKNRMGTIMNMAIVNKRRGKFAVALDQYAEAEKILNTHNPDDDEGFAYVYGNMSSIYYEMENYKLALEFAEKSLKIRRKNATPEELSSSLVGVAANAVEIGKFNAAEAYLIEALKLAQNNHIQLRDVYAAYAKLEERKGAMVSAMQYMKLSHQYKDSIYHLETSKQINELNTQYEVEKKEQQVAFLSTEKEFVATQLAGKRRSNIILVIALIFLLGCMFWFYQLNGKIIETSKEKDILLQEKDTLLKEIHHRVKNNLQVISALLTLQSKYVKDVHAVEALQAGQDRVESMALIHRDLYQHDNLKGVNTKNYLEKLLDSLMRSYQIDDSNITLRTDIQSVWLDVDTMIPLGLLINELISNALKHAFTQQQKGEIFIQFIEQDSGLFLRIKDNGKGISDIDHMKTKSFGYSLIQSFAKKLNADISYAGDAGLDIKIAIRSFVKAA